MDFNRTVFSNDFWYSSYNHNKTPKTHDRYRAFYSTDTNIHSYLTWFSQMVAVQLMHSSPFHSRLIGLWKTRFHHKIRPAIYSLSYRDKESMS